MKVKELIEKLMLLPQDAKVVVATIDLGPQDEMWFDDESQIEDNIEYYPAAAVHEEKLYQHFSKNENLPLTNRPIWDNTVPIKVMRIATSQNKYF